MQIHEPNCLPSTDQICLDCGLYFQNRRLLTMHQKKQHQRTSEANFHCPECDKSYTKRWCLTHHVNRVHRGIVKVFACKYPECSGKTFSSSSNLYTHRRTVHGDSSSEGISCEYCGKLFKFQSGVNNHIKQAHIGTEPVPCQECGKSYKSVGNLRFHMRAKHGDHKYKCEHCEKSFTYRSFYNKHLRVVHSGMKRKLYPCTICGKKLASSESQKVHVRTHTGERPFKCPSCDKAFISVSHLRTHRVVHTKEKPYGCKLCDKRFTQRGTLGLHLKKNHPKEQQPN